MPNNQNYIVSLCEKLQASQQQPTVAMIRKSANRSLPLPEVIDVLKRWKRDPQQFTAELAQQPESVVADISPQQRVTDLEARVASLESQVQRLNKILERIP
ncbi:hypothetical protein [Aliiglaciecola litoralis]|uniref:KfrA N-terminal DNA-binding domain-containing protein n=1 Tax=Aliiglaciecola litoralis TaxID=582857 RepID=A0ABP3WYV7_9ALTE